MSLSSLSSTSKTKTNAEANVLIRRLGQGVIQRSSLGKIPRLMRGQTIFPLSVSAINRGVNGKKCVFFVMGILFRRSSMVVSMEKIAGVAMVDV